MLTKFLLCAIVLAASPLLAAVDDEEEDIAPRDPNQPVFILTPETFDGWVFANVGNSAQAFFEIDSQVKLRIDAIDRVPKLQPIGAHAKEKFRNRQIACRQHAYEHGIDAPDITGWRWPNQ